MDIVQDNTNEQGKEAPANTNFVQDLELGKLKVNDLTDQQLEDLLSAELMDESVQTEPSITNDIPKQDASTIDESNSINTTPKKDAKQILWEIQVEENRLKQKHEAARKRREELMQDLYGTNTKQPDPKPFTKPENYDPYAEENLAEIPVVKQELNSLKEELRLLKEQRQKEAQEKIQEKLYKLEIDEISMLQEDVPELKTSKPFAQVEEEYASWYNTLGSERANKYLSDSQYREEMDKKGFKIPDDFDNYAALYEIRKSYKEGKYPTLRAAFRDSNLYDQLVEKRLLSKQAAVQNNAQEKAVEKLAQIKNQTPILDTTQSATPIEKLTMNEKEVEKEMIRIGLKRNPTAQEKAWLDSVYERLNIPH